MWELQWGQQLKTLLEIEKATGETPRGLRDRKVLRDDCRGYLDAFYALSTQRGYNEAGQQPLQVSEITAYLTHMGISGGEGGMRFFRHLLRLDRTYIDHHFKQQEKAQASTQK